MTTAERVTLKPEVEAELAALAPRSLAIGIVTYNNAATVARVVEAARLGAEKHFPGARAALLDADAGSTDGTVEAVQAAGLAVAHLPYEAAAVERVAVPLHGVPGRTIGLRALVEAARLLGARTLVLLEADVPSATDEWIGCLAEAAWEGRADLVLAAHARHRYDATITSLLLAPLFRTLFGCRLQQPLVGAAAASARMIERLAASPDRLTPAAMPELGVVGTALADGFGLAEAWIGPRRVESATRPVDLPTVIAQSVGAVFSSMERLEDLWLGTSGSRSVTTVGDPYPPSTEPRVIDVERMIAAFRRGLRDLASVWELVLAPETFGEVLTLDVQPTGVFRFSDALWARIVFDFALGYRYRVVHREHLLRSLVPLYLGRTAAYVLATRDGDAALAVAHLDAAGAAFARQRHYLVERWR